MLGVLNESFSGLLKLSILGFGFQLEIERLNNESFILALVTLLLLFY